MWGGLFLFAGVVSNISSVAPDHDEHHGGFVHQANCDWAKDEGAEEHQHASTTVAEESEGNQNCSDGGDVINAL